MTLKPTTGEPKNSFSLYIHVPFCSKKCDYCHFYVLPDTEHLKQLYLKAFSDEWALRIFSLKEFAPQSNLVSIYFGGGTPYLLGPEGIDFILNQIRSFFIIKPTTEITLEANPEDITLSGVESYQRVGINRISIGIQSLQDRLLKLLNRSHNSQKAKEAVHIVSSAGISNISIDLMYDLPTQTLQDWEETLKQALELPVKHLSLYNLTIEPHTVFYKKRVQLQPLLPIPEASLEMLEKAIEYSSRGGFSRYEISAFQKEGSFSRHNVGYWRGRPFLGFGPSACSDWNGSRYRMIPNIHQYSKLLQQGIIPVDSTESLSLEARLREHLAINLRMLQGVHIPSLEKRYEAFSEDLKRSLEELKKNDLLIEEENILKLSEKGLLYHDTVAIEIV